MTNYIDFSNKNGQEKFDTCAHRSVERVKKEVGCCGNRRWIEEYECLKLNIFPLTLLNCQDCKEYIKLKT